MVSRGRTGSVHLVCSDCGHALDAHLEREHPPWRWQERSLALGLVALLLGGVGALWISDQYGTQTQELEAPAAEEHSSSEE
jgi:hypothetical protein